jgi:hypothetical protein
LAVEGVV